MDDGRGTLPNFVVIGAQKSGTSTLCAVLGRHPDVFMCDPKEPHFFSLDAAYARGEDWYRSLFEAATMETAVGEGSTTYTMEVLRPHAADRLASTLPNARLIYIVRHPLERIESGWRHLRITGRTQHGLRRALERFPTVVDTSLYWKQIQRYRRHYPDHRIHVLFFEDFLRDPEYESRRCCEFLGIDPSAPMGEGHRPRNASFGRPVESYLGHFLRRLPRPRGFVTPPFLRPLAQRLLYRPLTERGRWTPAARASVLERVVPDAICFLDFYGKPRDFWNLDA